MHASASSGRTTIGTRALVVLGIRQYSGLGVHRIAVKLVEYQFDSVFVSVSLVI